jgi:hypothetical protein
MRILYAQARQGLTLRERLGIIIIHICITINTLIYTYVNNYKVHRLIHSIFLYLFPAHRLSLI